MKYELFAVTDVGRVRDHNEDNFAVCKDLSRGEWSFDREEVLTLSEKGVVMVVADGMGGTNAGEIASDLAQRSVKKQFNRLIKVPSGDNKITSLLKKFILQAHDDIVEYQKLNLDTAGMGTTLVIVWLVNNKLYVAWSGDSRCYIFNSDRPLYPFTEDHSLVWELVKKEQLTPEEARVHPESNVIIQSLGNPDETPKPEVKIAELRPGDRILVCSDGLNGMLSDARIHYLLLEEKNTTAACKRLVEEANKAGGNDNITVLLLDVKNDTGFHHLAGRQTVTGERFYRSIPGVKASLVFIIVLVGLIAFYHFVVNPHLNSKLKMIHLGTEKAQIFSIDPLTLDPVSLFLPVGPEIDSVVVQRSPEHGALESRGNHLIYKPFSGEKAYTDKVMLLLYGQENTTFSAGYELERAVTDTSEQIDEKIEEGNISKNASFSGQDSVEADSSYRKGFESDSAKQDSTGSRVE